MIRLIFVATLLLGAAAARAAETSPRPAQQREAVGFVERVRLYPGNLLVHAKIDTGARTSSINVPEYERFTRSGRLWVRFSLTNRDNETITFERPIVRMARIRDLTGPTQTRPVVILGICVGHVFRISEVNLSNRSGFNFQFLVGRRFLRQLVVVDPARQYTVEPKCVVGPDDVKRIEAAPGIRPPDR